MAIEAAAQEALKLGLAHEERARTWAGGLKDKSVIEIGPGPNYGSALIMLAFGAKPPITVVDPWIAPWDPNYHPRVYKRVLELIESQQSSVDLSVLKAAANDDKHSSELLNLVEVSVENLNCLHENSFDLSVSNAVLEHVPDMTAAANELWRVTSEGGMGLHMVDLRDHSQFDAPLDYLLKTRVEARKWYEYSEYHLGSLRRKMDYDKIFTNARFKIIDDYITLRANHDYFKDFVVRLRATADAEYQRYPSDDLDVLGVMYVVNKG